MSVHLKVIVSVILYRGVGKVFRIFSPPKDPLLSSYMFSLLLSFKKVNHHHQYRLFLGSAAAISISFISFQIVSIVTYSLLLLKSAAQARLSLSSVINVSYFFIYILLEPPPFAVATNQQLVCVFFTAGHRQAAH